MVTVLDRKSKRASYQLSAKAQTSDLSSITNPEQASLWCLTISCLWSHCILTLNERYKILEQVEEYIEKTDTMTTKLQDLIPHNSTIYGLEVIYHQDSKPAGVWQNRYRDLPGVEY